jgi:hypothetical protein
MMFKQTLVAATFGLLFTGQAPAMTNGGFGTPGLAGWDTLGDVAGGFGGAVLTTASIDYADDAPDAPGAYNVSGVAAAEAGVPGGIEEFSGLAIGTLDTGGDFAYEGSVIRQRFSVMAGDTLRFDWSFFTHEASQGLPDFAFVTIDGVLSTLAIAADATLPAGGLGWATGASTGTHGFSHVYGTGGVSTVAFGVVDVGDYSATSALWLDNVSVTPVPEPRDWMLLLAGVGLVGLMVERIKRRTV